MKTRVLCFTMLLAFSAGPIFAQHEKSLRIHQVGLNFSSLNSFGLHYKTGSEKTLLRLSLLSLNLNQNSNWGRAEDSLDMKQQSYGIGFTLGFEKRIPIISHFDFIWGLQAGSYYTYHKNKSESKTNGYESSEWRITPLIEAVLGVNYTISDHLVIGAEIAPGIMYSFGKTTSTANTKTVEITNSTFGFYFTNNSANLSLAYRFGK